jgi:two-component sensor histidine kinase/PAS domain-containing protein
MNDQLPDSSSPNVTELLDIIDLMPLPMVIADHQGIIRHSSSAWQIQAAAFGLPVQPGASLGGVAGLLELPQMLASILEGEPFAELTIQVSKPALQLVLRPCQYAGQRGVLLQMHPVSSESDDFQSIVGELRERELQFAAIAANLPGILYRVMLHEDGSIDFPYTSPGTAINDRQPGSHWLDRIHPDDRAEFFAVLRESAGEMLPFDLEQRLIDVPGQEVWVRNITRPHRRPDGAVVWDGMVLDITSQKRVEHDLQRSLREKDALLQEVHHRVKNNLQIISSLLDLQTLAITDPLSHAAFTESQRRIRAMALVHEQLYHVETMSRIDFGAYVRTLIDYLQQSFVSQAAQIALTIHIDEIWLDANAAIPCGLILNELVSNVFKHAFPSGRSGTIRVACERLADGDIELSVADDGIGLPAQSQRRTGALGLKLVQTLTRQLRGRLSLETRGGTVATLVFTPGSEQ